VPSASHLENSQGACRRPSEEEQAGRPANFKHSNASLEGLVNPLATALDQDCQRDNKSDARDYSK